MESSNRHATAAEHSAGSAGLHISATLLQLVVLSLFKLTSLSNSTAI
ncbi:hypothetical protein F441_04885 [Phytophthora nicotianae CJ01A1]|uniref:Uncharacterized protein n=3 Tax=Phytophthora nicotianae TaxID=4792 RepID=V9FNA9_PHYNI|nr:hypothetical protein F443_04888 [Phytophthora nicotianae P1569]ETP21659.1 hypothetical protein F441_04885 [Phytophthora nicotianae CJ01A1]ETP49551.1 hypothetical protein F442_04955 [Phytophthora nicotianae P10297]